jgi:DNA-binding protein HU-beta
MKDVELVTALSKEMDMSPHEVVNVLSTLYVLMGEAVSNGGVVTVNGVGQFEAKKKTERISVNPNGKKYLIPPKLTPVFKPASSWKAFLKQLDER